MTLAKALVIIFEFSIPFLSLVPKENKELVKEIDANRPIISKVTIELVVLSLPCLQTPSLQ
jgi:hypothetical protein